MTTTSTSASGGSETRTQWSIAIGAIVLAGLTFAFGRGSFAGPGQFATYVITVVPKDATNLDCASKQAFSGRRCGYDQGAQRVSTDRRLRPYVTVGRELLLLSGVFESKGAAAWLAEANAKGDDSRVTLECKARLLGTAEQVAVRWSEDAAFQPETSVAVAEVDDCSVKR